MFGTNLLNLVAYGSLSYGVMKTSHLNYLLIYAYEYIDSFISTALM